MPPAPFDFSGLPFGSLGASFFEFWEPFWFLGSTLGDHFGVSATWEAILAPRDHPGGPWEQQDGHEVVRNRIFIDFGVIVGPYFESCCWHRGLEFKLLFGLVSKSLFVFTFESKSRRVDLLKRCCCIEGVAKNIVLAEVGILII